MEKECCPEACPTEFDLIRSWADERGLYEKGDPKTQYIKLMEEAGIEEWEKVHVLDVTNGSRLETYAIKAPAGSGKICINGAAAHLVHPGDLVILLTFEGINSDEIESYSPTIVHVNASNQVVNISQTLDAVEYAEC